MFRVGSSLGSMNRQDNSDAEINMAPLIDMIFILLIFFLVTATFVRESGVEIQRPEAASAENKDAAGIFIAVTRDGGHRTIFWSRSSAPELSPEDVSLDLFPEARILHLDGLMVDAGKKAAEQARKQGMTVVMDAGTLREGSLDLVSRVDVLIASEPFAADLSGGEAPDQKLLENLRALGPRQVVITLGGKGSIGLDQGAMVRQHAFPVVSRDTTGAGDVYHGGYVYGLLHGWRMEACMAFASAAAALKCMNGRGWRGIPGIQAIKGFMQQQAGIDSPV